MNGGRYTAPSARKWPGLAFGKLQREASKFKSYIFLRISHHFTGCLMCFLLHQISTTDLQCLLSFLFRKGSRELKCLSSDYQRHVKFHWSKEMELRTLSSPPLHPYTQLGVLWYLWAQAHICSGGEHLKISTGSTEGNEEVLSLC